MKKVYLKILKEDTQKADNVQKKKDSMSKILVAGDSIAVGMSIWGLKQKGASTKGVKFSNIVPVFPAVRGGMDSKWIKDKLLEQLNSEKDFTGYKLIIIAGTNDSLNYALSGNTSILTNAISNIGEMIRAAIGKGIDKKDIAVMRIAKYEPSDEMLASFIANRQKRGWYSKEKTGEEYKRKQHQFVAEFNSKIPGTFDMVPVSSDGVHTGASGSKELLRRALSSIGLKSDQIEIPTGNASISLSPSLSITSKDCHVNINCRCIDSSINQEVVVKGVQRALIELGIKVEETGKCDKQTRTAIMKFQKQQQENGYKPPDGRDFLRCDACVGPNTLAALNDQLKPKNKTVQSMVSPSELVKIKAARIKIMSYAKGKIEDLQNYDEKPLKGEILEFTNSHKFLDGIKNYTISYSLRRSKQREVAQFLLKGLKRLGITNPYVIMGILGCTGKESGYNLVFERAGYSFGRIKNRSGAVANRVWKRFQEQGFGEPQDRHIRAITGGGRNGIALFNIAYGYSGNQKDERITMPVLVNGEINPNLYDKNLAGWKYRGTGPIQVTFKAGHIESASAIGMKHSEVRQRLEDPSTRMETAILLSCGYMKKTYPWALKKYGKEPTNIQEGLEWAQNCVGGINFASPAKPGNVLHAGFLAGIPWIKNNFRLKIEGEGEEISNV